MKAIRIHQHGSLSVLQMDEITVPDIKDDELLIQVHAAGVNPVDWKVREGYLKDILNHSLPLVLGWDVAGRVSRVGAKVTRLHPGDNVFAFTSLFRSGTYAEYIVARESEVAVKPEKIDMTQAAAIPLAALTAWQALFDKGHIAAGKRVLIHAAAGGVGHLAVQLAKWKGAYVVGTASKPNHDFARQLGADEIVDYHHPDWQKYQNSFDTVFDAVGKSAQKISWPLLRDDGILVTVTDADGLEEAAKRHGKQACFMLVEPNAQQLEQIGALINKGILKPHVSKILPFAEVKEAHKLSQEGHTRGKMVLQLIAS